MNLAQATHVDSGALESWAPLSVTVGGFIAVVVALAVIGRRTGERDYLLWIPRGLERVTGIPGWAAGMVGTASFGLLVAGIGFYNDVAWHIGLGRDEELFTAPHTMIVLGLQFILIAGIVGIFLATFEERDTPFTIAGLRVYRSAAAMVLVGGAAVLGFPLDELWHAQFGIDVTMWSPTHLMMIVGASLSPIVSWIALAEAGVRPTDSRWARGVYVVVALLVLDGLASVQGEFDFGVPQFQQLYLPVLVLLAGALALTAVRVAHGPGWSFLVVGLMLLTRMGLGDDAGALELSVRPSALYLGSAVAVEGVAWWLGTERRLRFALVSALGVSTLGLGVEWLWNQGAHQPWTTALLPEALIVGGLAAAGAAVVGVALGDVARHRISLSGKALALGGLALVVALAVPYPRTVSDVTADIDLREVDGGRVVVTAEVSPADAAEGARWFQASAWQGGGLILADMEEVTPGVWRSEEPVPVEAPWKTILRLHQGTDMMAIPLFLPADEEIDGPRGEEFPAVDKVAEFEKESRYLLREQQGGSALYAWGIPGLAVSAFAVVLASFVWAARGAVGTPRADDRRTRERV